MSLRARSVDALFTLLEAGCWVLDTPRRVRRWWQVRHLPPIPLRRPASKSRL